MIASTAVERSEAQRWKDWQDRGLVDDRRRDSAVKWVMAVLVLMLGALFGGLL